MASLSRNSIFYRLAEKILPVYKKIKNTTIDYDYKNAIDPSLQLQEIKAFNRNRKFGAHRLICKAPSSSLFFDTKGDVLVCCYNRTFIIGNVRENSLEEIWHGEKRKQLEHYIRNYNLRFGCKMCASIVREGNNTGYYLESYDYPIDVKDYPTRMSFEISNNCNLECIMCNGELSSAIRKNREGKPLQEYFYGEKFLEELRPFLSRLTYTEFFGGEPTLIKAYYQIWEQLLACNPACGIFVQTNGMQLPAEFEKLLMGGQFSIGVSIDSLNKEKLESIRKNSSYEKIRTNIDRYHQLANEGRITLHFNFCVMDSNWEEMHAFIQFCNDHRASAFFCVIETPYRLSLHVLDSARLQRIIDFLSVEKENLPERTSIEKQNKQAFENTVRTIQNILKITHINEQFIQSHLMTELSSTQSLLREKLESFRSFTGTEWMDQKLEELEAAVYPLDEDEKKIVFLKYYNFLESFGKDKIYEEQDAFLKNKNVIDLALSDFLHTILPNTTTPCA